MKNKVFFRGLPWIVFTFFGIAICLSGLVFPAHNWDEIPYTYLGSNNECNVKLHGEHYQYLEQRIPELRNENSKLLKSSVLSFRKRTLTDHKYFCSILPFYTTKKIYIAFIRKVVEFTNDTLSAVRILSVLPGLLWYVVLGLVVLFRMPGGAFAKSLGLIILGQMGSILAVLSTPDPLSCLLIALSSIVILLSSEWECGKLIRPLVAHSLAIFISGVLAGFAIGIRSNMVIVVIVLTCAISPYVKRSLVASFVGSALFSYAIMFKTIPSLLAAYPDSYSHLTLLLFHSSGLFGFGNPLAEVKQVHILGVAANLKEYGPFIVNIVKSSLKTALMGFRELIFYISILFLTTASSSVRVGGTKGFVKFIVPNSFWIISCVVGFGYIVQVVLFPLNGTRMIAPYISVIIVSVCLLAARSRAHYLN